MMTYMSVLYGIIYKFERLKEYSVFSYYIRSTFDFRQEILSLGENAEVLAPETFRNEMKKITGKMNKIYNS